MKKIGILGLNSFSNQNIALTGKSGDYIISGIYDNDYESGIALAEIANILFTDNPFSLITQSDLLVIPKTDEHSFNLMIECILNSKQLIIENPEKLTLSETDHLCKLSTEASVLVLPFLPFQFSPFLINARTYIYNPSLIQISYSVNYSAKNPEPKKSEILLNIIDTTLTLAKANVKRSFVNCVKVTGQIPQVINIRLEFYNGCTGNLFIDFISDHDEFSIKVYQPKQIVLVDVLKKVSHLIIFDKENASYPETRQISDQNQNNQFNEALNYINTFESINDSANMMESFKNSLNLLKKVEDKILCN